MIQVFLDESDTGTVLSMAGYISTVERWNRFSDEWEIACSEKPSIKKFLFSDWSKLNGQFLKLSQEDADQKLLSLYKIIADNVSAYVSCAVNPKEYRAFFNSKRFPKAVRSPYYCCLLTIMTNLPRLVAESDLTGPVDFIFDRQVMEEKHIYDAWYQLEEMGLIDRDLIKSSPSFKTDDEVLPLQAADMLAGRMRLALTESLNIVPPRPSIAIYGQQPITGHHFIWNGDGVRKLYDLLILSERTAVGGTYGGKRFISFDKEQLRKDIRRVA
jgi:Protein of unknown function (DUF3800)